MVPNFLDGLISGVDVSQKGDDTSSHVSALVLTGGLTLTVDPDNGSAEIASGVVTPSGDLGGAADAPVVERIRGAATPTAPTSDDLGKVLQVAGANTYSIDRVQTSGIEDGAVTTAKIAQGTRVDEGYGTLAIDQVGKSWRLEGTADSVGVTLLRVTITGSIGVLRLYANGARAGSKLEVKVSFDAGDTVQIYNGADSTPIIEESSSVASERVFPFRFDGTAWSPWREATDPHEVVQGAAGGRRIDSYQTVTLNNETKTWDITGKASTPADISGVSVLDVAVNGSSCQLDMRASELGPIKVGDLAVLHTTFATRDSTLALVAEKPGEVPDYYYLSPSVLGQKKTVPVRRTADKLEPWYPSTDPREVIRFSALGRTVPSRATIELTATEKVVYLNTLETGFIHETLQIVSVAAGVTGKLRFAEGLEGDVVHTSVTLGADGTLALYKAAETTPFYTYSSTTAVTFDLDVECAGTTSWRVRGAPPATTANAGLMTTAQVVTLNAAVLSKAHGRQETDVSLSANSETILIPSIAIGGLDASSTYLFTVGARLAVHRTGVPTTCGYLDIVAYGYVQSDSSGGVGTTLRILGSTPDQSKLPTAIATATAAITDSVDYDFRITATRSTDIAMVVDSVEYWISSLDKLTVS